MDLLYALAQLKAAATARIAEAARQGDAAAIHALADTIGGIEADLKAAREIEARRVRYARELRRTEVESDEPGDASPVRPVPVPVPQRGTSMPRAAAASAAPGADAESDVDGPDPRQRFLELAEKAGSRLVPMTRTLYRTTGGKTVAVPFANEVRPGRWLLSVEDMRYAFVALLCQAAPGDLRAFVLPWRALEPVWKGLSRNGRHVKLTVAKKADGWSLQLPGTDGLRIDSYLDAYAALGPEPSGGL